MAGEIFISYRRADEAWARSLHSQLRAEGVEAWYDALVGPGQDWRVATAQALEACRIFVLLFSENAAQSSDIAKELAAATLEKKLIIPVRLQNIAPKGAFLYELASRNWVDAHENTEIRLAQLAKELATQVQSGTTRERVTAPDNATGPTRPGSISICVLPFANISGDVEQEYFSDGISEDIITDLSKVSSLWVAARNTAFTFKGKSAEATQVARQLGVTHILNGSVRKSGGRVRITAQLVEGATGGHIWAERYDRDLSDIFALQDEISQTIVRALRLRLMPEERKAIEERGTESVEAYDLFLRGHALTEQMGAAHLRRAIELYQKAVAIDPTFRRALSGLLQALNNYARTVPQDRDDTLNEIKITQERLIALEPGSWKALRTRAVQAMNRRDYLGAERLLEEALQTTSQAQESIGVRAWYQELVCRFQEAVETYRPMIRQDPHSLVVSFMMQSRLDAAGRADEAQAEYQRSKDLPGDRGMVEFLAYLRIRSGSAPGDVRQQYRQFVEKRGPEMHTPIFDELDQVVLEPEKAHAMIANAVADGDNQNAVRQSHLALLAGSLGATDVALAAIRSAYVDFGLMPQRFLWLPTFTAVRRDMRFKNIVRDLGLYAYWRKSGKWGDFARPSGEDDFELIR
jgi:TolB-like protein